MNVKISTLLDAYLANGNLNDYIDNLRDMGKSHEKWISLQSLDKVVIKIHIIYLSDPNLITGEILGRLANRLIGSELELGGPYLSKDDLYTNTLIAQLFRTFNSPLPNLEKYLLNKKIIPKTKFQRDALSLSQRPKRNDYERDSDNRALSTAKEGMKQLNPVMRKMGNAFLGKIISLDKRNEISLLSLYFLNSLTKSPIKDAFELSHQFGVANIYAWIAYTIYDDFIDEEGSPDQLSLANVMHRLSYQTYTQFFFTETNFINFHYNSVDNSNMWELKNCRFIVQDKLIFIDDLPKYGQGDFLAQRSVGHVLGPKLLLKLNDISPLREQLIHEALNKYLIARQIGDDIKDWRQDLKNGHISYIVSKLLTYSQIPKGQQKLDELTEKLQQTFWDSILEESLLEIISNINFAKDNLSKSELFKVENEFVQNVLEPLQQMAILDLNSHLNNRQFLKTYLPS